MDHPDVPERAILAWEKAHDLRVTVHDLQGSLWPFLEPGRFQHSHPICQAVKLMGRDKLCSSWEIHRLRRDAAEFPAGRVQVCHAGLVEWMVPVFGGDKLEWVLFAGVRSIVPGLLATYDDYLPLAVGSPHDSQPLPPVNNEQAEALLEHLRQLAARLRLWRLDNESVGVLPEGQRPQRTNDLVARRTSILRFVAMRHTHAVQLQDLADQLNLSPSRTSHAVRESCGQTFQALMIQARLRTAMGLLRHSGLSIPEVALSSGFESPRQFYRLFRHQTGLSPLQYRKTAQS